MVLPEVTEEIVTPDIFWSAGDSAFQRSLPRFADQQQRVMFRLANIKANLNYNLLTHRRLVITDSSILMNPALIALLDREPDYGVFLSEGVIVPSMRDNASSFEELTGILKAGQNYTPSSLASIGRQAKRLDKIRPQIARSDTESNRKNLHEVGRSQLLTVDYWHRLGFGEVANELVQFVPDAMNRNNTPYVRQTEFWQFADELDKRGNFALAQKIRIQLTVEAMGIMAGGFGLPHVYPAAFGDYIDHAYGTQTPIRANGELVGLNQPLDYDDLDEEERDILFTAADLSAKDIHRLRQHPAYENFLSEVQKAQSMEESTAPAAMKDAYIKYRRQLYTDVGIHKLGRQKKWGSLRTRVYQLSIAQAVAPLAVGTLSHLIGQRLEVEPIATAIPSSLSSISMFLLTKGIGLVKTEAERQLTALELQARTEAGKRAYRTRKKVPALEIELYGPLSIEYWRFAKPRPPISLLSKR